LFGFARYGETKLANILFTSELAQRLAKTSITVNCLHPGVVRTGFNRNNGRPMDWLMRVGTFRARTPAQGADTLVWLATDPAPANVSGGYFTDRHLLSPSPIARDPATAARLWAVSMAQTHELVGGVFR
jgi:NAD(P)-dependent dehydrogenase (short-subunit alcohol dehydrogenase family)